MIKFTNLITAVYVILMNSFNFMFFGIFTTTNTLHSRRNQAQSNVRAWRVID